MEEHGLEGEKQTRGYTEKPLSLRVAITAITAALYTALGYIFQPISYLGLQFRVAELIVGMCILFPWEGIIGNVIGVFFVNLTSPLGLLDLLSCVVNIPALYCIVYFRNKGKLKYLGGVLYAIMISVYIALLINFLYAVPIWITFLQVLISEVILATLGILLFENVKRVI
ncbi:MAG: QueT transporter family protein [Promethearchaeia archaeon]